MQRLKKPLVWLALVSLIVGLVPLGLTQTVEAANPPAYFMPDDPDLLKTSSMDLADLNSDKVKVSSSETYPVEGTYSQVSTDLAVTVQQLQSRTPTQWEADSTRIITEQLTDNGNNRFSVNLRLFPGYNKVTFTGSQGNSKRSDTFYVLYDRTPTLVNANIIYPGGGSTAINLNEDARAVASNSRIMVRGIYDNATRIRITNDSNSSSGEQLATLIEQTKEFFTSYIDLVPGLNTLTIEVGNETSKITFKREVYFFDQNQPFVDLALLHNGTEHDLLGAAPTVSKAPANAAITGQVLLPYKTEGFNGNNEISVVVNRGAAQDFVATSSEEVTIPGPDGVTPAYRLITFTTTGEFDFDTTVSNQTIDVTIKYGDSSRPNDQYRATKRATFKYAPGQQVIKNMYLLEGYETNPSLANKKALNNSQVTTSVFYILVESDDDISDPTKLVGKYLPLSVRDVNLRHVASPTPKQAVYEVTGFANGTQQVRFYFENSPDAFYNANITYVSKSRIHIRNLLDGQTLTINSSNPQEIRIEGEYVGFGNSGSGTHNFHNQVFINGVEQRKDDPSWLGNNGVISGLEFPVSDSGPFYYGQNTIILKGKITGNDPTGKTQTEITETIRIFIVDENVSVIEKFIPVAAPTVGHERTVIYDNFGMNDLNKIFEQSTDFVPTDEGFTTGRMTYDLVLHGGGAEKIELYEGSKLILAIPTDTYQNGASYGDLVYDFSGTAEEFILRIRDLKFDRNISGAHIYNLELINRTGSRTTQKLEVKREVSGFRILAPQPTVGGEIIVNRNFVRFDIEAEGATSVKIGKEQAVKRTDLPAGENARFVLDYVGLKKDGWTTIKIEVDRNGVKYNSDIKVYYASAVAIDSQFMAEKVSNKYSVFNKKLELSFPKGTVLQNAVVPRNTVVKFYPETKLLFGIADPDDGVVERRNDYGGIIFDPTSGEDDGYRKIERPVFEVSMFQTNSFNFSRVSDVYWISGGLGELDNSPATNGLPPYSSWYSYPSLNSHEPISFMTVDPTRRLKPSQRGQLTIAFDPNVVDAAGTSITVFRLTHTGVWENIGGEVDTKKGTITVPFDEFGYYKVMKLRSSYKDITNHGWAREVLNALYSKGVMRENGYRSDAFGTDDRISRGEFATLLVKGLNLPLNYDDNQTFFDVSPDTGTNTWTYAHIETAARAGIISGVGDSYFGVGNDLTREQAAIMIARALELKLDANDTKLEASLSKTFLDSGRIDYYARPAVQAVYKAKIMSGTPVTVPGQKKSSLNFNPKSPMTRAEAGKIAVELLKKSTKMFPKNLS
ncbi:S-layer homology domain-containing protein [Paenibacillus fonticola]|uniref:S-layer homology domain-containing protein n=1 Tax=Paenibacillus fonticola TaxID=379896 RepID=UPI00038130B6|nr:S-layer homology domain-containing protein [Paenibacillus fonticola]